MPKEISKWPGRLPSDSKELLGQGLALPPFRKSLSAFALILRPYD
jgi:hypothetical protein